MSSLQFSRVRPPYTSPGLWSEATLDLGPGWTAVVGPNGCGKTTLLALACGQAVPSQGTIIGPWPRLMVPQIPIEPPGLGPWDWPEGARWASLLEVREDWWDRWATLSAGERQRGLLAWCLAQEPAVLALDEPTNHLDEAASRLVLQALGHYEGVGLVASHDERLLTALATRICWPQPGAPWVEQARWPEAKAEAERRARERETARTEAVRALGKLEKEGKRRRALAHQGEAKNSKRGLEKKDSDGRAKIDGVRVSGKDAKGSHSAALWEARIDEARGALPGLEGPVKRGMTLRMAPPPRVWSEWKLTAGSRVVVTGPNGTGKSTWLAAQPGLEDATAAYLTQEAAPGEGVALVRQVQDSPERHEWLRLAARWGLDPRTILVTADPSPGETQKLRLAALGLRPLGLLALDEPTNHLDLEAKTLLADALRDFAGTVLLISHDRDWWEPLGFRERVMGLSSGAEDLRGRTEGPPHRR